MNYMHYKLNLLSITQIQSWPA